VNKEELVLEIRKIIIQSLSLDQDALDQVANNVPFLREELGIDSIDILELVVALERKYKIKVGNAETAKEIFKSIDSIADFILDNSPTVK